MTLTGRKFKSFNVMPLTKGVIESLLSGTIVSHRHDVSLTEEQLTLIASQIDMSMKVDKVTGKGLSTEDYTTIEKSKLSGIESSANNYSHPAYHSQSEVLNLVSDLSDKEPANVNIQDHVLSSHAPANAQKNSDITKEEIEAKLTGVIDSHSHAGGADPYLAKLVLSADKATGANTTPVTLELSFNYKANSKYVIDIYAIVSPTASGTGCGFSLDVDTAVTYVGTFVAHQLAATGTLSGSGTIGDRGATSHGVSSGMVGTGLNFVHGGGLLITGDNAGVATFYFRSETTAVTTCKPGSIFLITEI